MKRLNLKRLNRLQKIKKVVLGVSHAIVFVAAATIVFGGAGFQEFVRAGVLQFTDAGGNDATAQIEYLRDSSDNPVLDIDLTTSDTNAFRFSGTALTMNTAVDDIVVEGATADAFETTITFVDPTADRTITAPDYTGRVNISGAPVAAGATLTITQALYAGLQGCILLDTAAGSTITLPAATGTGDRYCFIVSTVPTSNQHRLAVVGNDEFVGSISVLQDAADSIVAFEAADAGDNDHINLNGTTTGGASLGEIIEIWDIATDNWAVRGTVTGTGTEATPFSTGNVS